MIQLTMVTTDSIESRGSMEDKIFYEELDFTINELMQGIRYIACDIGRLNEVLIELHKRQRELKEGEK